MNTSATDNVAVAKVNLMANGTLVASGRRPLTRSAGIRPRSPTAGPRSRRPRMTRPAIMASAATNVTVQNGGGGRRDLLRVVVVRIRCQRRHPDRAMEDARESV